MFSFFKTPTYTDKEITIVESSFYEAEPEYGIECTHCFDIYLYKTRIMIGHIDLRVGESDYLYYLGHIGYNIFAAYRGNHYAAKASRLVLQMAQKEEMKRVLITCNPDNIASYKTIESLGARLLEVTDVPMHHELYQLGDIKKCVFEIKL